MMQLFWDSVFCFSQKTIQFDIKRFNLTFHWFSVMKIMYSRNNSAVQLQIFASMRRVFTCKKLVHFDLFQCLWCVYFLLYLLCLTCFDNCNWKYLHCFLGLLCLWCLNCCLLPRHLNFPFQVVDRAYCRIL